MLSIACQINADYYESQAREDYFERGGEPPGHWHGEGARELGLEGRIKAQEFSTIARGFNPITGEALVRNAGSEERHIGLDLTFSAPKSVSAVWAVGNEKERQEIEAAHTRAVKKSLSYVEENAGYSRIDGGREYIPAKLVFALYNHGTSRAQDPDLHTHAVAVNAGVGEDGRTRAIERFLILEQKMVAGAMYRANLAHELRELGYNITRDGWKFDIEGAPKELLHFWSKRRQEIVSELKERGFDSARAATIAALSTRAAREETPRAALYGEWREAAERFGFTPEKVLALKSERKELSTTNPEETLKAVVKELERKKSFFSEREFLTHSLTALTGLGGPAENIVDASKRFLSAEPYVVRLGTEEKITVVKAHDIKNRPYATRLRRTGLSEEIFSTRATLEREREILESAARGREIPFQPVKASAIESVATARGLSAEQAKALSYVAGEPGRLKIIVGNAGAGKSFVLSAAKEVWEKEGYQVRGAALSGKVADDLQAAGIKSTTVFSTLKGLREGTIALNSKTILVLDEAAMTSTKDIHALVQATESCGAKFVLAGDYKQLQSIEAGGIFKAVAEQERAATLKENFRQKEEWQKLASSYFAEGLVREAFNEYAKRGFYFVHNNRHDAMSRLVSDWSTKSARDSYILTGTRAEAADLNVRAQGERQRKGELGKRAFEIEDKSFFVGDRVRFTNGSRILGVRNHTRGTIESATATRVTLLLDSGRKISFLPKEVSSLDLGYAGTTHTLQGGTALYAYALLGGPMQHRELSYVQFTRHKIELRLYTDKISAGEREQDLIRALEKSRQQTSALEKKRKLKR